MTNEEMEFYFYIKNALTKHPEWIGAAINAVSDGSQAAVEQANKRASQYQLAMTNAIALIEEKRITPKLKEHLNALILRGMFGLSRDEVDKLPNLCEYERRFIRSAAALLDKEQ